MCQRAGCVRPPIDFPGHALICSGVIFWICPFAPATEVAVAQRRGLEVREGYMILPYAMNSFVAIDFETANQQRDSACAVGLAKVRNGSIEAVRSFLIRPPSSRFEFTHVHGLRWEDVRDAPTFGELWPTLLPWFDEAEFMAAHNARFDRKVLRACSARNGIRVPGLPFTCTVELARSQWGIYPTRLPDVCRRLGISLRHHDPGSDAEACARIVLAAEAEGWRRTMTG